MSETIKILSVDDSSLTRTRFIANPLREAGYEVVEGINGEQGLELFAAEKPDCVISDLLMPVMDGFAFVEALREQGYTGPVIVVSADIQQSSRERIEQIGVDTFLNKPFNRDDLLKAVEEALQASSDKECAACN